MIEKGVWAGDSGKPLVFLSHPVVQLLREEEERAGVTLPLEPCTAFMLIVNTKGIQYAISKGTVRKP